MSDAMLTELYKRCFQTKAECERLKIADGERSDRLLQVAYAKNKIYAELIDIRTNQIAAGTHL